MVAIGFTLLGLAALGLLFWFLRRKQEGVIYPKWLLAAYVACAPLAIIGIETGWIYSCTGRQPWTIYGIQRTVEAATNSGNLGILFFLFSVLYIVLLVITGLVMYFYFKRNPVSDEFQSANDQLNV